MLGCLYGEHTIQHDAHTRTANEGKKRSSLNGIQFQFIFTVFFSTNTNGLALFSRLNLFMAKDKFSIVRQIWMKWFHTTEHNQKHTKRFIKCMHWLMPPYSISWKFWCIFCNTSVETNEAWKMKIVKCFRNRRASVCVRANGKSKNYLYLSLVPWWA